jgi:uncharacterized protein YkwD
MADDALMVDQDRELLALSPWELARLLLIDSIMTSKLLPFSMNNLKRLTLTLVCVAILGCTTSQKITQREAVSPELFQLERKVHHLVNQYRISRNLPPLTTDGVITQQARIHSHAMARQKVPFGHDGFGRRVKRISKSLPHRTAAENVAYNKGYPDCAQQAVQEWLKSTQHRANIRGSYRLTGIGIAKNQEGGHYFTQIFWQ